MDSTQLIELYESLKQQLGDKATDWNMFLEGYVAGLNYDGVKKHIVDKAWEFICTHYVVGMDYEDFVKTMEE